MKVILISGKAQHGKDTIANFLKNQFDADGYKSVIIHYADLLKYICKSYFEWDGNKDEKGRELLQHIGTDVIRKQNPTFWVDFVYMLLNLFNGVWDYVIIPDCRFLNEISTIKDCESFDSIHIRVKRTNFISPLTPEQLLHPSETALDDCKPDYWIENSSSLEALNSKVIEMIYSKIYA